VGNGVQVVWLKRDLRLRDHEPLCEAAERGPVVVLFVVEPWLWTRPPYDPTHYAFVRASLVELDRELRALGGRLTVRVGRMVEVLDTLHRDLADVGGVAHLWSHQETGLGSTYARDRAVKRWCRAAGVPWTECLQDGVMRAQPHRDGWSRRWERQMRRPVLRAPEAVVDVADRTTTPWDHGALPTLEDLGLTVASGLEGLPEPGEAAGLRQLQSFLSGPACAYRRSMSSPLTAWSGGSRLSAHLAWGNLSVRFVAQKVWRAQHAASRGRGGVPVAELEAFGSRLRWRGHFMQKLEDEPEAEERDLLPAMRSVRQRLDADRLGAWREGRTGYPMVDACMRSLAHRRWLNFRMRAMVVSFACYDLWLPWKAVAEVLAPWFLDFEPGIHYPQVQMQAGSTGINSLRIYDPVKQGRDHDPEGRFVHRWVPELRGVPPEALHHLSDLPENYPRPLVEHRPAAAAARRRIEAVHGASRREAREVHRRHGSRRGGMDRRRRREGELPF
jgi:deoxyribodipyrimidine photo-lyase